MVHTDALACVLAGLHHGLTSRLQPVSSRPSSAQKKHLQTRLQEVATLHQQMHLPKLQQRQNRSSQPQNRGKRLQMNKLNQKKSRNKSPVLILRQNKTKPNSQKIKPASAK